MLASNSHEASDDDFRPGASVSFSNFTLSNGGSTDSTPYIVRAPVVTITKSIPSATLPPATRKLSGQMFYVMGAKDMIFSTNTPSSMLSNGLFVMNESPLSKLQENQSEQDH
jgi:hypothetical protein